MLFYTCDARVQSWIPRKEWTCRPTELQGCLGRGWRGWKRADRPTGGGHGQVIEMNGGRDSQTQKNCEVEE